MLEGGCGFVDLPGLNDADVSCLQQTRDGITDAKVIFVVLRRGLKGSETTINLLEKCDIFKRALLSDASERVEVVMLFNRELDGVEVGQISSDEEAGIRESLEMGTRERWEQKLASTNAKLRRHEPELARTDD